MWLHFGTFPFRSVFCHFSIPFVPGVTHENVVNGLLAVLLATPRLPALLALCVLTSISQPSPTQLPKLCFDTLPKSIQYLVILASLWNISLSDLYPAISTPPAARPKREAAERGFYDDGQTIKKLYIFLSGWTTP